MAWLWWQCLYPCGFQMPPARLWWVRLSKRSWKNCKRWVCEILDFSIRTLVNRALYLIARCLQNLPWARVSNGRRKEQEEEWGWVCLARKQFANQLLTYRPIRQAAVSHKSHAMLLPGHCLCLVFGRLWHHNWHCHKSNLQGHLRHGIPQCHWETGFPHIHVLFGALDVGLHGSHLRFPAMAFHGSLAAKEQGGPGGAGGQGQCSRGQESDRSTLQRAGPHEYARDSSDDSFHYHGLHVLYTQTGHLHRLGGSATCQVSASAKASYYTPERNTAGFFKLPQNKYLCRTFLEQLYEADGNLILLQLLLNAAKV